MDNSPGFADLMGTDDTVVDVAQIDSLYVNNVFELDPGNTIVLNNTLTSGDIVPASDNVYNIGTSSKRFREFNVAAITSTTLSLSATSAQITFGTAPNIVTLNVPTAGGPYTATVPNSGLNAAFVMTEGGQTINGAKNFTTNPGCDGLTGQTGSPMVFSGQSPTGQTFSFQGPPSTKTGLFYGRAAPECGLAIAQTTNDFVTGSANGDMVIVPRAVSSPIWLGNATAMARFTNAAMTVGWSPGSSYGIVVNKDISNNRAWFGWSSDDSAAPFGAFWTKGGGGGQDAWCPGIAANSNDFITGSTNNDLCISAKSGQSILFGIGATLAAKFDAALNLLVQGTAQCTGSFTGALQLAGGAFFAKDVRTNGQLYFANVSSPTNGTAPAFIGSVNDGINAKTNGPQVIAVGNGDWGATVSPKFTLIGPKYIGYGAFTSAVTITLGTWFKLPFVPVGGTGNLGDRWSNIGIIGSSGGVWVCPNTGVYRFMINFCFPNTVTAGSAIFGGIWLNPTFSGGGPYSISGGTLVAQENKPTVSNAGENNITLVYTGPISAANSVCVGVYCSNAATTSTSHTSYSIEALY